MAKGYTPLDSGLQALGKSEGMSKGMLDVAKTIVRKADQRGEGTYEAATQTVRAGWKNDPRAGAVVREKEHDWRDSRDRVLLRVTASMKIRGQR